MDMGERNKSQRIYINAHFQLVLTLHVQRPSKTEEISQIR